jgi:hypothetical protein
LADHTLVDASKEAMGFPTIPGVPPSAPTGLINPVLDYDWGPRFRQHQYAGGMIPFARTRAERLASGDPRLSLEERYGTHEGYVEAVQRAATNAVAQGFLLQPDAMTLIAQAEASDVLEP